MFIRTCPPVIRKSGSFHPPLPVVRVFITYIHTYTWYVHEHLNNLASK